ncbi:MAG: TMEM165/GDT1 family protein [Candidatus Omnitrophica bacterium]|nr:TMEM165/GDT1 family protein [Candidatus Omnitrophota bacterium]
MTAFIASLFFVFLAEMADKTQLLVMSFAARYKIIHVLTAVFIAALITNFIAVVLGKAVTSIIPVNIISFAASAFFIIFGLWIFYDTRREKDKINKKPRFGPITKWISAGMFIAFGVLGIFKLL